jgi:putative SOS response-associated peptidase YedK
MCYSAMIEASVRDLSFRYQARVDVAAFIELFGEQEQTGKLKLLKGFESFVDGEAPETARSFRNRMARWKARQRESLLEELSSQEVRLTRAQERQVRGESKTVLNEIRIAGNKINQIRARIEELERPLPLSGERIFPGVFAPLIVWQNEERWIRPFRYRLRPAGEPESFDKKFDGTYNIRRDRLKEVRWWRDLYGSHHGVLVMRSFFEHVSSPDGSSRILEFREEREFDLLVPCLFDRNDEGSKPLDSFGLITDDPNPEVLAAGHDRTPLFIRPESLSQWLDTESAGSVREFDRILGDPLPTRFIHRLST